ncbi:MAG TPA: hypothetical protein VK661_13155 [Planctomycetota bacterium]|nr:hypothetical protein [Planctomycetota bacterium]
MNASAQAKLLEMAAALRRKAPVHYLLAEVTKALLAAVPADGARYDLSDETGRLWSRVVRPGQEPERPGLGSVTPLRSKETFQRTEEDGLYGVSLPLGIGEPASGRLVLKRRSAAFSDEEVEVLRSAADLISLGFRARPFDPPPKPRGPFDDDAGPLV